MAHHAEPKVLDVLEVPTEGVGAPQSDRESDSLSQPQDVAPIARPKRVGSILLNYVTDSLYGTRFNTQGAEIQLPRKIPIRTEPKSYFANERTFLNWLELALLLGSVSTLMLGFTTLNEPSYQGGYHAAASVPVVLTCVMCPLGLIMAAYCMFMFLQRQRFMKAKMVGYYNDVVGPVGVASTVVAILLITLYYAVSDLMLRNGLLLF